MATAGAYGTPHRRGLTLGVTSEMSSLVAQLVKNLPTIRETWVGKIPWRRERSLQYPGLEKSYGLYSLAPTSTEQVPSGPITGMLSGTAVGPCEGGHH